MLRLAVILPLILVSCTNGCQTGKEIKDQDSTHNIVDNNPLTADSIVPELNTDTANLDEYGKDSLKLSAAFQRAANALSMAYKNKDVITYTRFTPPSLIKMYGGPEKYRSRVKAAMEQDKVVFDRIVSGPVKRVQAAVDDEGYGHGWYCLMPVRRFRKENGKDVMEMQWLGGQTLDMGKTIYFLDVTGKPREQIMLIMPDLRFALDQETLQ